MTISEALNGGSGGLSLRFTPPAQLHRIDLDESPEARMVHNYRRAVTLLPNAAPDELAHMVLAQEVGLARLIDEGAVYVANCIARSEEEPEALCTAQYALSVKDADLPREEPLATLAKGIREPGEPRATTYVDYPAGQALVIGEELSVTPSTLPSGRTNTDTYRFRQAVVIMPFPDRRRTLIASVSSRDLRDWQHFTRMLNDVVESLHFSTGVKNSVSDRLEGLM